MLCTCRPSGALGNLGGCVLYTCRPSGAKQIIGNAIRKIASIPCALRITHHVSRILCTYRHARVAGRASPRESPINPRQIPDESGQAGQARAGPRPGMPDLRV